MYQVDSEILNEIAQTQAKKFVSQQCLNLFKLSEEEKLAALSTQHELLMKNGMSDKAATAYLKISPILMEQGAIASYIVLTDQPELRAVLPDLTSPNEAVELMDSEMWLSQTEKQQLLKALTEQFQAAKTE